MNIAGLDSEQINQHTRHIDELSTEAMVELINREDWTVADAVKRALKPIAAIIDLAVQRLNESGRIIYIGAGTSGRLGILDASECPPTYGVDPTCIQGLIAGGSEAIFQAQEGAEDCAELGEQDLLSVSLTNHDIVIGIAASGRTPYVIGALDYARKIGAATAGISCVKDSELSKHADITAEIVTGAEVISGSTRMKAGTAQKMTLNMISTSVMIRLGKVYDNLMVDVSATNDKLIARAKMLIQYVLACDEAEAADLFEASGRHVKTAILMGRLKKDRDTCRQRLKDHHDSLKEALQDEQQ